jgi:alpha/beta hydrolase fold
VAVLGHSTGGMTATRFTLMSPERVRHLVLEDPLGLADYWTGIPPQSEETLYDHEVHWTDPAVIRGYVKGYFVHPDPKVWEPLADVLVRATLSPDYPRWARAAALTFQMIYQQPVRYEYHQVAPPVLLIVGAEDHVVPLGQSSTQLAAPSSGSGPSSLVVASSTTGSCCRRRPIKRIFPAGRLTGWPWCMISSGPPSAWAYPASACVTSACRRRPARPSPGSAGGGSPGPGPTCKAARKDLWRNHRGGLQHGARRGLRAQRCAGWAGPSAPCSSWPQQRGGSIVPPAPRPRVSRHDPEQSAPAGVPGFDHRQGRLGEPWTRRAELVVRGADVCTFGAVLARSESM